MSEKYNGLYVTFEKECSQEYIDTIKPLIGSIKGVVDVRANVSTPENWIARSQAYHDLKMKILDLLIHPEK